MEEQMVSNERRKLLRYKLLENYKEIVGNTCINTEDIDDILDILREDPPAVVPVIQPFNPNLPYKPSIEKWEPGKPLVYPNITWVGGEMSGKSDGETVVLTTKTKRDSSQG